MRSHAALYFGARKLAVPLFFAMTTGAAVAAAQSTYDPVSLELVSSDKASIRLRVTAGASGTPGGFVLEWMTRANYDAQGGWPALGTSVRSCAFFGTPTLTVGPATTYDLGSNEAVEIEVGDLFDETGIDTGYSGELPSGMEYAFRAYVGSTGTPESEYSATLFASTLTAGVSCVLTQGYWKTHAADWPVMNLMLGSVAYTQAQLLNILTTPAQGNGLVFLAHQLIAAKLNVASGASPPGTLITDADALIGALVVPPVGNGYLAPADASDLTEQLDEYNSGQGGVPHCEPVPTTPVTWSDAKRIYR